MNSKDNYETFSASQIEMTLTLALDKPQRFAGCYYARMNPVLYRMSTLVPLPCCKIDPSVKDAMSIFLKNSFNDVEEYYSEYEKELDDKYSEKGLPQDGYTSLKFTNEKEFTLIVDNPYALRLARLIVRYDNLLKKLDFYWLSGFMGDAERLTQTILLNNKIKTFRHSIGHINKALCTKKYKSLGFGGEDELTRDEIVAALHENSDYPDTEFKASAA